MGSCSRTPEYNPAAAMRVRDTHSARYPSLCSRRTLGWRSITPGKAAENPHSRWVHPRKYVAAPLGIADLDPHRLATFVRKTSKISWRATTCRDFDAADCFLANCRRGLEVPERPQLSTNSGPPYWDLSPGPKSREFHGKNTVRVVSDAPSTRRSRERDVSITSSQRGDVTPLFSVNYNVPLHCLAVI
jgi:hypothetical protein